MSQQRILEKQFDVKQLIFLTLNDSFADVFGSIEDWIMPIGDFQLLLEPSSGTWMIFDDPHGTVDTTGFRVGEVIFDLDHGELAVKPNPEPTIWSQDRRFNLVEDLTANYARWLISGIISNETYHEKMGWLEIKDRRGSLWKLCDSDRKWVTWNGSNWVEGQPPRNYSFSEAIGIWQKFLALKTDFFQLWGQLESGLISHEEYCKAVNQLRLQDSQGNWWQVRASDGAWLCWSGQKWVEKRPEII